MKRHSRREFLSEVIHGTVAAGTGLMVLDPMLGLVAKAQLPPAITTDKRAYTAGRFGMELDGQFSGWIQSTSGGNAVAIAPNSVGTDQIQRKHIGGVKYEDVTINCGTGMSKSFYEWIKASFENQLIRKNCAIVSCDFEYKLRSRMELFNALVTEVSFPACDASSKDAAKMTIRFAPESTRMMTTGNAGSAYQGSLKNNQAVQKKWLPANFRLKIDGLDCARVRKIEAVTAKFVSGTSQASEARLGSGIGTRPSLSNLIISLPESRDFYQWHEDVVKGNAGQGREKGGTLEYLSPDLRESIFSLSFHKLQILKLVLSPVQANSESARMVTAEMYCSELALSYGPAALA